MNGLLQILKESQYWKFLHVEKNRISFDHLDMYKKIEVIVNLTAFLDRLNIKYHIDSSFAIEIKEHK